MQTQRLPLYRYESYHDQLTLALESYNEQMLLDFVRHAYHTFYYLPYEKIENWIVLLKFNTKLLPAFIKVTLQLIEEEFFYKNRGIHDIIAVIMEEKLLKSISYKGYLRWHKSERIEDLKKLYNKLLDLD